MSSALPWLAHYDSGVPPSLAPYPRRTLLDYLSDAARESPSHPALFYKGATMSYRELERLSDAFASALEGLGVRRGDRVALLLPNCPQFVIAEMGAWKLGALVAPLNPLYTEHELEAPLVENQVETIVTLTRFYDRVKKIQSRTPLRRVIATSIKTYFPPLLRLLFTLGPEKKSGDRVALASGDHDFARLLQANRRRALTRAPIGPDDPAVLLLSGGTTGTPKGVIGRHAAYVETGLQVLAWTRSVINIGTSVMCLPLPLFHVYANVGVQSLALVTRNPVALVPNPRDLSDLAATIQRVKPTFLAGVPTLYSALLTHSSVTRGKVDFKSIRICFSGAAALMAETKQRFESLTGGRIVEGYSLTEAMMALCVNPVQGPNKLGSVGMPLPDVRVRIFDADEGLQPQPPNAVGEIALSASQIMVGYWNRSDETAGVLRDHIDEGRAERWLHTGDLGYLDDDGYLFIVDRKKDLIKTGGYQVWPREVEEVLAAHPAVAEVGVAGAHDETRGEIVKAWVVLREGQNVTAAQLRAHCRGRLANYKVPTQVVFRSDLPKTMVGKVLRRELRNS